MASSATAVDELLAHSFRRSHRTLPTTTGREGVGGVDADGQRIQRWLDVLRDGSEVEKLGARRGLAGVFEQRGMLQEAIELLETNVQAGVRSAETLRWLSRLYQAQGNEGRSLEAAVNASQQPEVSPAMQARPTRPRAIRPLLPYLLLLVGLGIAVGVVLWLLTPLLKP
jgi:hypothetical protein